MGTMIYEVLVFIIVISVPIWGLIYNLFIDDDEDKV